MAFSSLLGRRLDGFLNIRRELLQRILHLLFAPLFLIRLLDPRDFLAEGSHFLRQGLYFRVVGVNLIFRNQRLVVIYIAPESRNGLEVIQARDGIEFMIVAARAVNREALEALDGRAHHVVHVVVAVRRVIRFAEANSRTYAVIRGRNQAVGSRLVQLIASQLLDDELVVGLVFVEGLDDVVAIAPGILYRDIEFEARAIRVAYDIQPVAPPALAIIRRREQLVD